MDYRKFTIEKGGTPSEVLPRPVLPAEHSADQDQDVFFLDFLLLLAKRKRLTVALPLAVGVLAAIISLLLPNYYTAETKILPPQQNQSLAASMLGQLGPLAGLAGRDLGLKNPMDMYVAMLQSRTVADALISKFDLLKLYSKKRMTDARAELEDRTLISAGKDGLIYVSIEDRDPNRAAEMANAYVDQLSALTHNLALSEASQRRLFFEQELQKAKDELSRAEQDLRKTEETTGLIQLDSQSKVILESIAQLQAQITAKEVQLRGMRSFATEENPDLMRLQQELEALRSQLAKLQRSETPEKGNIYIPTGKVPSAGLEYVRKFREVKYRETIFELLAKQFEAARMDEAKNVAIIQVVDKAVPPEKKSRPKRALIVLASMLLAFFAAVGIVILQEINRKLRNDPERSEKLRMLRNYLRVHS